MKETIEYLSTKKLLGSEDKYIIPRYQRNYAWENRQISQLIHDVADYVESSSAYYIGTLVVHETSNTNGDVFEIIDGQQRFTTLTLLLCLLKNEYTRIVDTSWYKSMNLQFQSRKESSLILNQLFLEGNVDNEKYNSNNITSGYSDVRIALKKILKDKNLDIQDFCKYLFDNVKILRVTVPYDTDLNHYFEIMNTRGVQLEKHEILKAAFLEVLDPDERYIANKVWESCANMERYVQYGFTPDERDRIFGQDWNTLVSKEMLFAIRPNKTECESEQSLSIEELLRRPTNQNNQTNDKEYNKAQQRFNTIINFSNFLLHVLRIQTKQDIRLDDKRLLESFSQIKNGEKKYDKGFVEQFIYNLLKIKYLYDRYVIKREILGGTDKWSLEQLVLYDRKKSQVQYIDSFGDDNDDNKDNREAIMLLSMFHVSTPTLNYKHWLCAVLKWLFEKTEVKPIEYIQYLQNLAKAFLFDRYLARDRSEFYNIIFTNNGLSHNTDIDWTLLDKGTDVENFIFNYLDYLLWKNYNTPDKKYFVVEGKTIEYAIIKDFEYTFRSSVEHYYPQHPIDDNLNIRGTCWLNDFGNLCLISGSKNSRLSNYMPSAKKDHYSTSPTIDSIKQLLMMSYITWDIYGDNKINEIADHGEKMKALLREQL